MRTEKKENRVLKNIRFSLIYPFLIVKKTCGLVPFFIERTRKNNKIKTRWGFVLRVFVMVCKSLLNRSFRRMMLRKKKYGQYENVKKGFRKILLRKQGNRCNYCHRSFSSSLFPTIDHIVPVSKTPANNRIRNLQLLCERCHMEKTRAEIAGEGFEFNGRSRFVNKPFAQKLNQIRYGEISR